MGFFRCARSEKIPFSGSPENTQFPDIRQLNPARNGKWQLWCLTPRRRTAAPRKTSSIFGRDHHFFELRYRHSLSRATHGSIGACAQISGTNSMQQKWARQPLFLGAALKAGFRCERKSGNQGSVHKHAGKSTTSPHLLVSGCSPAPFDDDCRLVA